MKRMKKMLAIMLAAVLTLAMALPVLAVQGTDGTVDIVNAKKGDQYDVYRVLDLNYEVEYADLAPGEEKPAGDTAPDGKKTVSESYSYTANSAFTNFFKTELGKDSFTPTQVYNYITSADRVALGKKLQKYVTDTPVARTSFVKCETDGSAKINNLPYGYYLMVPTGEHTSALFSLSTVTPNATIENKSQYPTPDKTVKDADEKANNQKTDTAAIGDTLDFQVTGKVPNMTSYDKYKFVISDKMNNLTYVDGSMVLNIGGSNIPISATATDNVSYTWDNTAKELIVTITNMKLLTSATEGADITFTYKATVDHTALIGGNGNENTVKFIYSNNPNTTDTSESTPSKTTTYVIEFKITKTDGSGKAISGATWSLEKKNASNAWDALDTTTDATVDKILYTAENTGSNGSGIFTWKGLDAGTYRLTELTAPSGRVKIETPIEFTITSSGTLESNTNLGITLASTTGHPNVTEHKATGSAGLAEMKIQNLTQSELPATGGAGLYVVAAVALLALLGFGGTAFLKKKVNGEE